MTSLRSCPGRIAAVDIAAKLLPEVDWAYLEFSHTVLPLSLEGSEIRRPKRPDRLSAKHIAQHRREDMWAHCQLSVCTHIRERPVATATVLELGPEIPATGYPPPNDVTFGPSLL